MFRFYVLLICLYIFCGCKTSKVDASPKQIQLQKDMAEATTFKITSNWANPIATTSMNALSNSGLLQPGNTASRINIGSNNNLLIMEGPNVEVYLPFFGERRVGGGYNTSSGGIEYKGDVEKLNVEYNEKRKLYQISFVMKENTESYDVTIDLFQNLTTRINIDSSHRTSISYDGYAEVIPEKVESE